MMLNSLLVKNYRNLENLEIPSLARVNLIVGKNNVGKSSLLEALYLYFTTNENFGTSLEVIRKILLDRDELFFEQKDFKNIETFSPIFTNRKIVYFDENKFIFIGESEKGGIVISPSKFYNVTGEDDNFKKRERIKNNEEFLNLAKQGMKIESEIRINGSGIAYTLNSGNYELNYFTPTNDLSLLANCKFLTTKTNSPELSKLWDEITLTNKEKYVIEALSLIEPIEGLSFIETTERPKIPLVKTKNNQRIPLKSMGDGINHILSIALNLVNCENGCFLIDEFENGLHYSVQTKLFEVIFSLAEKLNAQVFATTHSNDTLKAFSEVINNKKYQNQGKIIRLENKNGLIKHVEISDENLKLAMENDIEIR
ncbi:AAA family ATPase [bacterium]|nr:AAA family ATPase [bacterium]